MEYDLITNSTSAINKMIKNDLKKIVNSPSIDKHRQDNFINEVIDTLEEEHKMYMDLRNRASNALMKKSEMNFNC